VADTSVNAQRRKYCSAEAAMTENYIPIRLSHLLRHCSVGSIVRGPEYLMTVKDIRDWNSRDGGPAGKVIPYVDQVRAALGIEQELREPPTAKELDNGQVDGVCVPGVRFPTWMRCPSCGLLHSKPWKGLTPEKTPRCQNNGKGKDGKEQCKKRPELEQVSWVLAHADGHLGDVPWHYLAHQNEVDREREQCRADWEEPYLSLIDQRGASRKIRCKRCDAEGEFFDSLRFPYKFNWRQPWIPEAPETVYAENELAVVLEINDARVHSPDTNSALVIPPESRIRKGSLVDLLYSSSQNRQQIERARTPFAKKSALNTLAGEFRCSVGDIEEALQKLEAGYPLYGESFTQGILLEKEYEALIKVIPDVADGEDFVTKHYTNAWKRISPDARSLKIVRSVGHLVAVNRLKEILVLRGFRRLGGELVPPDIIGLSNWLPGLELFGEGIFFTLEENILEKWETDDALRDRAEALNRRYVAADLKFDIEVNPSPRFLLLHTLAHLLIRQLETEAGYPAASLNERIYCTSGEVPMSGILIYVAVPDVVGSLGGLAELAEPERFLPLLSGVFDSSEWCSLDPVCSEHEGQGPHLLNRAACHACALVPEPSCAFGNVLLDRTFIVGDDETGIPIFLNCID
jgi:hypothetical protein